MSKKNLSNQNKAFVLSSYIKLVRAAESVTARSHRHLSAEKLSFGQFAVLEALYHLGPLYQKELAGKILKTPRNIGMIVDNLEVRNLVWRERNTADRRYLTVHLTKAGQSLFEKVFPRHIEFLEKEMGVLTQSELEELGRLCRILGKGGR